MEKLKISDNKRYFMKEGKPFIWIADTAWTLPQRLKWDDVDYYFKKRKQQGFTVIQIVALDPEQDLEIRNPAGVKALIDDDLQKPNEEYFKYLDWIIDKAEEYGFYILLLPVWGQLVVGHSWSGEFFDKTVTEDNAYDFGCWIGNRYRDRDNVIWCLGGDRQPIHLEVDYKNVWRKMAEGLAYGVLDEKIKYNESKEVWAKLPITYHACYEKETGECSTMSYWTEDEEWISFIMIQSGHGKEPKNYELVSKEYERNKIMPVWDGEPAYELMPTTWPMTGEFHGSWMVRKRAYWSLFSGAFGHTYGHSSVWCMISEKERSKFRPKSWYDALNSEGSKQIKILRDFLESRDLSCCVPAQNILIDQSKKEKDVLDEHKQACIDKNKEYLCIYFPSGGVEKIDLKSMKSDELSFWWFNPRDGKCYDDKNMLINKPNKKEIINNILSVKAPTTGDEKDWILVIDKNDCEVDIPGKERSYYDLEKEENNKKEFDW